MEKGIIDVIKVYSCIMFWLGLSKDIMVGIKVQVSV